MFKSKASTSHHRVALAVISAIIVMVPLARDAFAQSGGGGGGGSSGSSGGGAASSGTAGTGSAATGASGLAGQSPGNAVPRAFPSTPQTGLGGQQVPSADNAEPSSPVNRLQAPLGQQTSPSPGTPGITGGSTSPGAVGEPGGVAPDRSRDGAGTGSGTSNEGVSTGTEGTQMPEGSVGSSETPAPLTGRPEGQPIAPQSPSASELGSGGTARVDNSRQGAAGHSLESCMEVWEPATHMTKEQWRETCERTLTQGPELRR
jgi:hypothetical protein